MHGDAFPQYVFGGSFWGSRLVPLHTSSLRIFLFTIAYIFFTHLPLHLPLVLLASLASLSHQRCQYGLCEMSVKQAALFHALDKATDVHTLRDKSETCQKISLKLSNQLIHSAPHLCAKTALLQMLSESCRHVCKR